MGTIQKIAVLFTLLSTLLLAGCPTSTKTVILIDSDYDTSLYCPSSSDDITWWSYGEYEFNFAGDADVAWQLIRQCGWYIYDGHDGTYGDTLQIISPDLVIILIWSGDDYYSEFIGYDLDSRWNGETHYGADMGMYTTQFHELHSGFVYVSRYLSTYYDGYSLVHAYFNDDGYLERLSVGYRDIYID